jgi:hypothetical protein
MRSRVAKKLLLSVFAAAVSFFLILLVIGWVGLAPGFRSRAYWMFGSVAYKSAVLSSASDSSFRHVEWNGDGWGGLPTGDWVGYVVYDPSDSLPLKRTDGPAVRVNGIPCDVVSVRRLERGWYSVVTDMNEFWDSAHPGC